MSLPLWVVLLLAVAGLAFFAGRLSVRGPRVVIRTVPLEPRPHDPAHRYQVVLVTARGEQVLYDGSEGAGAKAAYNAELPKAAGGEVLLFDHGVERGRRVLR